MDLNYSTAGKVTISMFDYIDQILAIFEKINLIVKEQIKVLPP